MSKEIKIALLMAASLFMEILDGTIVTTALPSMAHVFHVSSTATALLVSSYLITVAIFIPLSGWMAQRFGKKKIWLLAVAGFTLSSLGSALAPSFGILLGMRLIQGMSGALMTPTARLIVLEKTPASLLLKMTSYLVWPALIAPAIAPLIGGFFVTYLSWHWIFLINLPIGLMIFFIGLRLIPTDSLQPVRQFDWTGFVESALGTGLILAGAEAASHPKPQSIHWGLSGIALGIFILILFVHHLLTVQHPLYSLKSLKIPAFRISQTGCSFLWLSVGAMPYLLTLFLQNVLGLSAVKAGSYIIFIFIGNIGIKPFTTPIIKHLGYKGALESAFGMIFISALCLAFVTPHTLGLIIMFWAFVSGVGRSLALTAYNGLSFSEIPNADRNSANTLSSVTSSLAQGLGVSLVSILVQLAKQYVSVTHAYALGFIFLALLMLYPMLETWCLPDKIGANTL